jgi:hypothetical protein
MYFFMCFQVEKELKIGFFGIVFSFRVDFLFFIN